MPHVHLGPAVAILFLNDDGWAQPARAYLPPAPIDRLTPFLPTLERCAVEGATHFVAIVTLESASRPSGPAFAWAKNMNGTGHRFAYILRSVRDPDRHYVGPTSDVENRLEWHNHRPCELKLVDQRTARKGVRKDRDGYVTAIGRTLS